MLRSFIRKYLGLDRIEAQQQAILNSMKDAKICLDLAVQSRAMARIIAKLDPIYGLDEMDPERKAASDKLSNEIIHKLLGEHQMSNRFK